MRFLNRFHDSDVGRGQPRSNRSGWDDFQKKRGRTTIIIIIGVEGCGEEAGSAPEPVRAAGAYPGELEQVRATSLVQVRFSFFHDHGVRRWSSAARGAVWPTREKVLGPRKSSWLGCDLTGAHRRAGKPKIRSATLGLRIQRGTGPKPACALSGISPSRVFTCLRCDRRPLIATLSVSGSGRPA